MLKGRHMGVTVVEAVILLTAEHASLLMSSNQLACWSKETTRKRESIKI